MLQNLEFTNSLVIIISVIIGLIIIGLIIYIFHLKKRIHTLKTPKYGFLGKSLYPIMVVALLVGTLYFITTQEPKDVVTINANKNVTFDIKTDYVSAKDDKIIINLSLDVMLHGENWALEKNTDDIDIYWDIIGPTNVSMVEIGMNKSRQSGFDIELFKGEYTIKTTIIYGDEEYEYIENIVVK